MFFGPGETYFVWLGIFCGRERKQIVLKYLKMYWVPFNSQTGDWQKNISLDWRLTSSQQNDLKGMRSSKESHTANLKNPREIFISVILHQVTRERYYSDSKLKVLWLEVLVSITKLWIAWQIF